VSGLAEPKATAPSTNSYAAWNLALFGALLPGLPADRHGDPVLLSCDDEVIRSIGAGFGIARDDAVEKFAAVVELQWRLRAEDTLKKIRRACARFREREQPVEAPPLFLGALAMLVLAASRMTAATGHATHNYYERLWQLVGEPHTSRHDLSYVPRAFALLADWLADDLDGRHGYLLLPDPGRLAYVGVVVNQCVFRRRDRERLAHFFADRWPQASVNIDPVRLLQVSRHRHVLTDRAQRALADPAQEQLVRTALHLAHDTWDGSLPQSGGGRGWRARLQLRLRPSVGLLYSVRDAPSPLRIAPGRLLRPGVDREPLQLDHLASLRTQPLTIGDPRHGAVVIPCCGETLIFETQDDAGLVWVQRANEETVFVLSCATYVKTALAVYASQGRTLAGAPAGWALFERVPRDRLPQVLLQAEVTGQVPIWVRGGLRLDRRVYLTTAGPHLESGDLENRLAVTIDGAPVGQLGSDDALRLELAEPGTYTVDVGGVRHEQLAAVTGGNHPSYGRVSTSLGIASLRHGAGQSLACDEAAPGICGALLDQPYVGPLPLMRRSRAPVTLIDRSGRGRTVDPGAPPDWLREAGLDPAVSRWEVPIDDDTVWVIAGREAICVRPGHPVPELDVTARAAVAVVLALPRPAVRDLQPNGNHDASQTLAELKRLVGVEEDDQ